MRTIIDLAKVKTVALAKAKKGVTAIEYGLIAGFVALVIIGGVQLLGTNLNTFFTNIATTLGGAAGGAGGGGEGGGEGGAGG
jgi:pilus assembly protein Flp/PilA